MRNAPMFIGAGVLGLVGCLCAGALIGGPSDPEGELRRVTPTTQGIQRAVPAADPSPTPKASKTKKPVRRTTEPRPVYFANCVAAERAGAAPLHRGDPGYRLGLDRDKDGDACER